MGADKPMCGAKTRPGTPCRKPAGHGTEHVGHGRCKLHGGATPRAEVAGQVFLARREMAVMGRPLDIDAPHGILECIRIAAGEVMYASERIAELDADEAVGPVITTTRRPLKEEKGAENPDHEVEEVTHGAPALHIWIQARHDAMDRLVRYEAAALKAGVEERMIRLAEGQSQRLVEVIRAVLTELGVIDHPEAPAIVRRQLTLAAGPVSSSG